MSSSGTPYPRPSLPVPLQWWQISIPVFLQWPHGAVIFLFLVILPLPPHVGQAIFSASAGNSGFFFGLKNLRHQCHQAKNNVIKIIAAAYKIYEAYEYKPSRPVDTVSMVCCGTGEGSDETAGVEGFSWIGAGFSCDSTPGASWITGDGSCWLGTFIVSADDGSC